MTQQHINIADTELSLANEKMKLEVNDLRLYYGDSLALKNINLQIPEKRVTAFIGPSGCGKSTLMRMLAGFEAVTEGDIFLAGENLKGVPPYKRPVNMMFQSYALFPHMNVEKNIGFGLKQEGMPKGEIADRVAAMLALVKMEDYAKRKPDQLSGGQKQRVALARSLAKQPKVLLLDEPLGALDRKLREETQFELVDLQEKLGITFMIVTHDQEEAMTVADRIAVMNQGNIVQIDPPVDMYERPDNRYVADFLGDINLIEARVQSRSGGVTTLETGHGVTLKVESDVSASSGQTVWFAARPEKFTINLDKPKSGNVLAGTVWEIAYLGGTTIYKVKLDSGEFIKAAVSNRLMTSEQSISWEDKVWLTCAPNAALVLTA